MDLCSCRVQLHIEHSSFQRNSNLRKRSLASRISHQSTQENIHIAGVGSRERRRYCQKGATGRDNSGLHSKKGNIKYLRADFG